MAAYLYNEAAGWIFRREDSVYIPANDPENPDYITFIDWVNVGGNTYDIPIEEETDLTFSEDPWW